MPEATIMLTHLTICLLLRWFNTREGLITSNKTAMEKLLQIQIPLEFSFQFSKSNSRENKLTSECLLSSSSCLNMTFSLLETL